MQNSKKVILITGCSSGFGLLFAARLASKGNHVIATMRNLEKKQPLLDEVKKRGGKIDLLSLDVTDHDSIAKTINAIDKKYGKLDVLVNNAGYGILGFFEDLTDKQNREIMETNFFGVLNVTRAALPLMRKGANGKIINISSVSGFSASPCFSAYSASKWALEAFSESLRYELKPFGINVLAIEPGSYKTEIFFSNANFAKDFNNPKSPYFPLSQSLKKLVMNNLNKNKRDPEDVAILLEKLITQKNPPFRNIPDFSSKCLFLTRKFMPFRLYSWIVYNIMILVTKKNS